MGCISKGVASLGGCSALLFSLVIPNPHIAYTPIFSNACGGQRGPKRPIRQYRMGVTSAKACPRAGWAAAPGNRSPWVPGVVS